MIGDRSYTVKEIEDLRQAVMWKLSCGFYAGPPPHLTSWTENRHDTRIEDQVRTYMLAGHTAADLIAAENDKLSK